jgi:glycosyltransferase involved in cell wall biosynthesis
LDREADLVWINDPVIGSHCATRKPTLYDVTDDWRETLAPPRVIRRIIAAEDRLARSATTVVCSKVLRSRWQERYDLDAHLVTNGVDAAAHATAARRHVPGDGPHVGYIGTLHEERLDIEILLAMAADPRIGTVHLVGPNSFGAAAMRRLLEAPRIAMHGPVPSADVPSWMASMDVLVCPHVLSAFTLSLDAIKSYEYLATGRPIVATPTSGFQELGERVRLSTPAAFVEDVMKALTDTREPYRPADATWDAKAEQMAEIIRGLTT